jgi:hypothetical protein
MSGKSERQIRHAKACSRKVRYETMEEAKSQLRHVRRVEEGKALNAYKCAVCKGYHVGTTPTWRRPDR